MARCFSVLRVSHHAEFEESNHPTRRKPLPKRLRAVDEEGGWFYDEIPDAEGQNIFMV
jgi:hypothetical protein